MHSEGGSRTSEATPSGSLLLPLLCRPPVPLSTYMCCVCGANAVQCASCERRNETTLTGRQLLSVTFWPFCANQPERSKRRQNTDIASATTMQNKHMQTRTTERKSNHKINARSWGTLLLYWERTQKRAKRAVSATVEVSQSNAAFHAHAYWPCSHHVIVFGLDCNRSVSLSCITTRQDSEFHEPAFNS